MGRGKSDGFVYRKYAAETQNTINLIRNVCINLVFQ